MKNNSTTPFSLICESVAALASEPTIGDLDALQRNLEACNAIERDYLTRLFRFELGRFLIEDAQPKLDSPKHGFGLDDCQALLALSDKLNGLEGFAAMPKLEELYSGETILYCDAIVQKEIKDSLSACATVEDAECIFSQVVRALEKRPNERIPLLYYTATRLHKVIMGAGVDYIEGSLSDDEKLRHKLFGLVRKTPPHEYPLFLSELQLSGTEPTALLPHHIIEADDLDTIAKGLDSLKACYDNLPSKCFAEQMFHLLPTLKHCVVGELTKAMISHDIELSENLRLKLELLNNGAITALIANPPKDKQKSANIMRIRAVLSEVFDLIYADGENVIVHRFGKLFRRLGDVPGLACEGSDYATANLADYVIATVCAEFRLHGHEIWDVAMAKIMLYYAIRLAMAGGNLAFWETESYKALMTPCGV